MYVDFGSCFALYVVVGESILGMQRMKGFAHGSLHRCILVVVPKLWITALHKRAYPGFQPILLHVTWHKINVTDVCRFWILFHTVCCCGQIYFRDAKNEGSHAWFATLLDVSWLCLNSESRHCTNGNYELRGHIRISNTFCRMLLDVANVMDVNFYAYISKQYSIL